MAESKSKIYEIGDVFQITEVHGRDGWIGAFVLATEIKSFGIQGFVSHIVDHNTQTQAYIRLSWDEIAFIGHTHLIPDNKIEHFQHRNRSHAPER